MEPTDQPFPQSPTATPQSPTIPLQPGQVGQILVQDYVSKTTGAVNSVVVTSNPQDLLRSYSNYFYNIGGRGNAALTDTQGNRFYGIIFSKKQKEAEVRNLVNQINQGLIPPHEAITKKGQIKATRSPTVSAPSQIQQFQQPIQQFQQPIQQFQQPIPSLVPKFSPKFSLPLSNQDGYQTINMRVLKPTIGQKLMLNVGSEKYPMTITQTWLTGPYVTYATFKLADGTEAELSLTLEGWKIPGYEAEYSITLN